MRWLLGAFVIMFHDEEFKLDGRNAGWKIFHSADNPCIIDLKNKPDHRSGFS